MLFFLRHAHTAWYNSPEAIVYSSFRLETKNKKKSKQSCESCQKKLFQKSIPNDYS